MNAEKTQEFKAQLIELRDRINSDADVETEAVAEKINPPGDVSSVPSHLADRDTEGLDAEIEISARRDHLREHIRDALTRIETGTFGKCQSCGKEISHERLKAVPYTPFCLHCEERVERELPERAQFKA